MSNKIPTFGSRIQVYRNHAKKTSGGLTKSDLMMNKHGRVVSKAKHFTAKKEMRLLKHGFGTQKGKFGFVKVGSKSRKSRKSRSRKMKGGMEPLSPSELNASNSLTGGRRRRMHGGSGMSPLLSQGAADWSGDTISGAGITNFGSGSNDVQLRAGMSGGMGHNMRKALALGRNKSRGKGVAMSGGTGNRSAGGVGSAALQLEAGNA